MGAVGCTGMRLLFFWLIVCCSTGAPAAPTPVVIGRGGSDFDACNTTGVVVGLNPRGDNFLSVRRGPSVTDVEVDRLQAGRTVYVCEQSADGAWLSLVYPRPFQEAGACGVSSGAGTPRAYEGPCAAGWASRQYLSLIAGGGPSLVGASNQESFRGPYFYVANTNMPDAFLALRTHP